MKSPHSREKSLGDQCYCGKPKPYESCCGQFISGEARPHTPEQLMRSRYTAYLLKQGEYLLRTWFPATAPRLSAAELAESSANWQRLEIVDKSQDGDKGMVEFNAYYLPENSDQLACMHETSEFIRLGGQWLYVGGRVTDGH